MYIMFHTTLFAKYRKHILKNSIEELFKKKICLFEKASQLNIKIKAYEIMVDHVHLFIKTNPNIKISYIIQQLKGYSSYKIRKQFPFLKKYKALWTHSYYAETIGFISEESVKKYISNQKQKWYKENLRR